MDDNRKRTRAPNESKSSNDSNPPKKRIKLRLVRNRNQCNVTDQIQKLQRDVSTALNRIAPLCLNQNIINSKQIQSIIGALNIRNFQTSKSHLMTCLERMNGITNQSHVKIVLDAWNDITKSNNLHNVNMYYNHETKLIQFENHQHVNKNMPCTHKFKTSNKHGLNPNKNFDLVPNIKATFDSANHLRIFSSRTGDRSIQCCKSGDAITINTTTNLKLQLYGYLGYQSNLCEGFDKYFDVIEQCNLKSITIDRAKQLIYHADCQSFFGARWQSGLRQSGRRCPNCSKLLLAITKWHKSYTFSRTALTSATSSLESNANASSHPALTSTADISSVESNEPNAGATADVDLTSKRNPHTTMSKEARGLLHLDEIEQMDNQDECDEDDVIDDDEDDRSNWCLLWQFFINRWDDLNKLLSCLKRPTS